MIKTYIKLINQTGLCKNSMSLPSEVIFGDVRPPSFRLFVDQNHQKPVARSNQKICLLSTDDIGQQKCQCLNLTNIGSAIGLSEQTGLWNEIMEILNKSELPDGLTKKIGLRLVVQYHVHLVKPPGHSQLLPPYKECSTKWREHAENIKAEACQSPTNEQRLRSFALILSSNSSR